MGPAAKKLLRLTRPGALGKLLSLEGRQPSSASSKVLELHGNKGDPGYNLLHSPHPKVRGRANDLYADGKPISTPGAHVAADTRARAAGGQTVTEAEHLAGKAGGRAKITPVDFHKPQLVQAKAEEEKESKAAPSLATSSAGAATGAPMTFDQIAVSDVPKYAEDPEWYFQQKVDGIRGQIVIEPGKQPWFRSKKGELLQSTTAAKISDPLLKALGGKVADNVPAHIIDGELLNGQYHVFDMVVHGQEKVPWADRMASAEAWTAQMNAAGVKQINALPVARTKAEKLALWDAVGKSGAEGIVLKRRDAAYQPGRRVQTQLKAKITSEASVIVASKGKGASGGDNFQFEIMHNGKRIPVGGATGLGIEKKLGPVNVGDIVEVRYLWASPTTFSMQQPAIQRLRRDQTADDATTRQLRFVDKAVLDASVMAGSTAA